MHRPASPVPGITEGLRLLPFLASVFALVIGVTFLLAWRLAPETLTLPHSDWLSVKPNMAASLVLAGVALLAAQGGRPTGWRLPLVAAFGGAVAALGGLTLAEYFGNRDVGIDRLILPAFTSLTPFPARMPPLAAGSLLCLGTALVSLCGNLTARRVSGWASLGAGALSAIGAVAYVFGAGADLRWPSGQPAMALPATLAVLGLSLGLAASHSGGMIFSLISRGDATGQLARRLVLASVLVPFTAGWIRLLGERAGFYKIGFGLAIMVTFATVLLLVVVGIAAKALAEAEDERLKVLCDLQLSEARFRNLLEAAPDGILVVDPGGRIRLVNAQVESLFGFRREELLDQSIEILLPERFRDGHPDLRDKYFESPVLVPAGAVGPERWARRKDGSEFPVEITLAPFTEGDDQLVTAIVRDVTGLRDAQAELGRRAEALARSNAELEQFAYVASHDLQEPLRSVVSFMQLAERRMGEAMDDDSRRFVGRAVDAAGRMQDLIQDLLAYSRVGRTGMQLQPTSLDAALGSALANLRAAIEQSDARIVRSGNLPEVYGDATQLIQVFQNLVANAIKFKGDGRPEIRIGVDIQGSECIVSVADNGIGIDPKFFDRIFVIFQRLHSRKHYDGTGIGLSLCKKIVERHGGRIWVESRPGEGARFRFALAAANHPAKDRLALSR